MAESRWIIVTIHCNDIKTQGTDYRTETFTPASITRMQQNKMFRPQY